MGDLGANTPDVPQNRAQVDTGHAALVALSQLVEHGLGSVGVQQERVLADDPGVARLLVDVGNLGWRQLAAGHLASDVRPLVGLVEDDAAVGREELHLRVEQRQHQHVVVGDDDVAVPRRPLGREAVADLGEGAQTPRAVVVVHAVAAPRLKRWLEG